MTPSPFPSRFFLAGVALLILVSGCGDENKDKTETTSTDSPISVSGMLSQGYVRSAKVIADRKVSGSVTGNLQQDADEVGTISSDSGGFSLDVSYGDYVIYSSGGTYLNSKGEEVSAAPMMTPAPETSGSGWNITPLTTLVTTHPDLKTELDALGGWNTDIADENGVPAKLLRVAKTVETFLHVTSQLADNDSAQLTAMKHLATSFDGVGLDADNDSLERVAGAALTNTLSDTDVIPAGSDASAVDKASLVEHLKTALSRGVFQAIPDSSGTVVEKDVVADIESATDNVTQSISEVVGKPPVLTEMQAVPAFTSDTTPTYIFHSTAGGIIRYHGDCIGGTTHADADNNTVIFQTLAEGAYSNCKIQVTDRIGKSSDNLSVTSFAVDTSAPVISEQTAVSSPSYVANPDYTFSSNESGTIFYGGGCRSTGTAAVSGENTITFSSMKDGTYDNCTIQIADPAGNPSNKLQVSSFTVSAGGNLSPDSTAPTLAEVTPVSGLTNDRTPDFTFSSSEPGSIGYGGSCSSPAQTAATGNNTLTLNTLNDGSYADCTISVTDYAGNTSSTLALTAFSVDSTTPVLSETTPVNTPGNDSTPAYTFSSSESGTIVYAGSCSGSTTTAALGTNPVTFNELTDATYNNCTISVTDSAGNVSDNLNVSSFTIDTAAPSLLQVTPINSPSNDSSPSYTFSSDESGTIIFGGSCSSSTTQAGKDNNTVTFSNLMEGTHSSCTITVTDEAGNASTALSVNTFLIDTTAPTLSEVTVINTPTKETTPNFTFSSTEAGTIAYGGSCSSSNTIASTGNNTITFNTLSEGTYSDCTIVVNDNASNASSTLTITSFTVDSTAPTVSSITPNNSAANISISTTIAVTFSEAMDNTTITTNTLNTVCSASFRVSSDNFDTCVQMSSSPSVSNSGKTFAVTPSSNFAGQTVYKTKITTSVNDSSGNSLTSIFTTGNGFTTADISTPILAQLIAVTTPVNDTTPTYIFSSNEAGTIAYGGSCSSDNTSAFSGNNPITFNPLSEGTYDNCTITVTDNASNASTLSVNTFVVDTTSPSLTQVTAVTTPANNTTPNYTFSSTETGTTSYGGSCSSGTTSAVSGDNTITFNTLSDGTYDDCTITVTDNASNSSALSVSSFVVDTTSPSLAQVTAVTSPANNTTPNYTFSSTETGTISYGGSCSSGTTSAVTGNNPIIFNTLSEGTYDDCTITVTDDAGNSSTLNVNTFVVDTTAPSLAQVKAVSSPDNNATPKYTFSSTEAGTISYGGSCSSGTTSAVAGNNPITFNSVSEGTHDDCTITVTDNASNASNLSVNAFVVDTTSPFLEQVTAVASNTNDNTPSYTFSTNEPGTIVYEGQCISSETDAGIGENTFTFNILSDGVYSDCKLSITDSAGNTSNVALSAFTIDTVSPVLTLLVPVENLTNDHTPLFTFHSTENGGITFQGPCSSSTASATSGDNTITMEALSDQTYENCLIIVSDSAGNSDNLSISSFTIDTTRPLLAEVTPVPQVTSDNSSSYTFSTTEAGTITFYGSCDSGNTLVTASGEQTVNFNELGEGKYTDCKLNLTDAAGNVSDNLSISSFTIDITAPTLSETTPVTTPTAEDSPAYVFNSSEIGAIHFSGSCTGDSTRAYSGDNTITFSSLSPGNYTDCALTVTDDAGNQSDNLSITAFEVVPAKAGEFSIAFNPVITSINCEINTSNPSHLTVWAEVTDDGPLGDLRYLWYFSKQGWFGYEFASHTSNPTVLYGFSAASTSGTFKVWVTDGKGLGGTSILEKKITPGSC